MNITTLGLILVHARAQGLIDTNAAVEWRSQRRSTNRRRSSGPRKVARDETLTAEELELLLGAARTRSAASYSFLTFLADTGSRLGEVTALRWSDVDLEGGRAHIARSFSSGRYPGQTKTGR